MFENRTFEAVKGNKLFSWLGNENFALNYNPKDFVEQKEGDIIYQSNEESLFLYLIIEGEVKLKFHEAPKNPVVIKKGENDYFGEKEILQNSWRNSSAVANADCLLYSISKNDVFKLSKDILLNLYNENNLEPPANLYKGKETDSNYIAELYPDENFTHETIGNEPWQAEIELSKNITEYNLGTETRSESIDSKDEIIAVEQNTAEIITDENPSVKKINMDETPVIQEEIPPKLDEPSVQSENEIEKEIIKTDPENISEQTESTLSTGIEQKTFSEGLSSQITGEFREEKMAEDSGDDRLNDFIRIAKYISSDFNVPLTSIKNYAAAIRKKNYSKESNEISEMISSYSSLMNSYFNVVSFISGESGLNKEIRSFNGVINFILIMLAGYVKSRNIALFKKLDEDVKVNIDPEAFYHAAFQIIKNACDAIDGSGKIYVMTEKTADYIKVEFKDTGAGIPYSIHSKIFEPFMTHGKENALGLGLTITEKIIKEHGGSISIESKLGEGTSVTVSLPVIGEVAKLND